ncbi:MAG: hypothetical protein ABI051_12795 [Vicinamibacterales bacterium]
MTRGALNHGCYFLIASLLSVSLLASTQTGAKALFDVGGVGLVGVHYWFEDSRGEKFADPSSAGVGAKVALHVRRQCRRVPHGLDARFD